MQIVHFAPEKRLSRLISAIGVSRYVGCDLYPSRPELERIDILNTGFESASFDLLIANHVLEHVDDDMQALSEIYRVLRPGGYAILQTPFSSKLQRTWQDDGIQGEMARLMAYGQEDHVRLYGKDIFERFSASGLSSMVRSHEELLPGVDPIKNGVNLFEPFMLFRRE
ncbi:hypothetical protein GCM10007863_11040 [Dyella mobilis]|nr:hypothetical protein GCM10007863_11040 [Dyella mobilis]